MAQKVKKSFIMYVDMYAPTACLSLEQKGELWDAVFKFHAGEDVRVSDPMAQMAFSFFRQVFERDAEEYERRCEKNRENVRKRWEAKDTTVYDRIKSNTTICEGLRRGTKHTDNDNDNDNDNDSDKLNTPLSPLEGKLVQDKPARMKAEYPADFEEFWKLYPRKNGKDAALRAWKTKKREGRLPALSVLADAVAAAKRTDQWQRDGGQYIPHPATWLNQGRWMDEPEQENLPFQIPDWARSENS